MGGLRGCTAIIGATSAGRRIRVLTSPPATPRPPRPRPRARGLRPCALQMSKTDIKMLSAAFRNPVPVLQDGITVGDRAYDCIRVRLPPTRPPPPPVLRPPRSLSLALSLSAGSLGRLSRPALSAPALSHTHSLSPPPPVLPPAAAARLSRRDLPARRCMTRPRAPAISVSNPAALPGPLVSPGLVSPCHSLPPIVQRTFHRGG